MPLFGLFGPPDIDKFKTGHDVQGLIKALSYRKDAKIREAAAEALGELREGSSIEALLLVFEDKDSKAQVSAAKALGKIGNPKAVDFLLECIKRSLEYSNDSTYRLKQLALQGLREISNPGATARLVKFLRDWADSWRLSSDARSAIMDALIHISRENPEPVVALLKDKDYSIRNSAVHVLNAAGWKPGNKTQRAVWLIASKSWEEVLSIGTIAIQPLIAVAYDDQVAQDAITNLEKLLKLHLAEATPEDLQAIIALTKVSARGEMRTHTNSCGHPIDDGYQYQDIDCSYIRQLARQELIRRGLNA